MGRESAVNGEPAGLGLVDLREPPARRLADRAPAPGPAGPIPLALTLAGVVELLAGARRAVPEPVAGASGALSTHFALGALLLVSVQRTAWRTPALATATLASILEVGADRPGSHAPPATKGRWPLVLRAARALALARLLTLSARADTWER